MKHKPLRVFIGPVDVANVSAILAGALKEKGIKVTVVTEEIRPASANMKYDKVLHLRGLNILQKAFKYLPSFLKFFLHHNVFIFMFGASLLPYNIDLPILNLLHKKTIMWFHGSDIRHYESLDKAAKKAGLKYYVSKDQGAEPEALTRKMRMIRMVEKYVGYMVCQPSFSQLLTRDYYHILLPLDFRSITYNNTPNARSIVVHAPSSEKLKGTSYVLEAVDKLKREGCDFEFHLFRNTSNIEVREALAGADIAVDQLFATESGMFALEAMAARCAVLGGNVAEFSGYPKELPIIHTDPDNVYQNLKMLLENPQLRQELGEKGRKYVEKYHDSRKIADDILRLLAGNTEGLTSYDPKAS